MPVRVQRKRTKGWKMPPNTVYVGRPSKWGNPFVAWKDGQPFHDKHGIHTLSAEIAVASYRHMLIEEGAINSMPTFKWPKGKIPREWITMADVVRELRGKDLACWCPLDQPCHADVLLEIAND
jgi:hypothetical protein